MSLFEAYNVTYYGAVIAQELLLRNVSQRLFRSTDNTAFSKNQVKQKSKVVEPYSIEYR